MSELGHAREQRRRRRRAAGRRPAPACERVRRRRTCHASDVEHRRRGVEMRHALRRMASRSRSGIELAQAHVVAPAAVTAHGKHQPLQWNIGSVHRNTLAGSSSAVRDHRQRLQIGAAVVIHDALRRAGGAARVVDREQRALVVDGRPCRTCARDRARRTRRHRPPATTTSRSGSAARIASTCSTSS